MQHGHVLVRDCRLQAPAAALPTIQASAGKGPELGRLAASQLFAYMSMHCHVCDVPLQVLSLYVSQGAKGAYVSICGSMSSATDVFVHVIMLMHGQIVA